MKKSILLKQNKGITLIETILAVALLAVVVALGFMFYFTGFRAFDRNAERVDLQQNVRHSMSYITKRLLNANDADVAVIPIPTNTLSITNRDVNGNTTNVEQFRLTGTTLQLSSSGGVFLPFAEGITGFEVTRDVRTVTVTITAGTAQQNNSFSLSSRVLMVRR